MPKIRKTSPIHENTDANITCDFGDGDISRCRCRLPHAQIGNIVSSISLISIVFSNVIAIIVVIGVVVVDVAAAFTMFRPITNNSYIFKNFLHRSIT